MPEFSALRRRILISAKSFQSLRRPPVLRVPRVFLENGVSVGDLVLPVRMESVESVVLMDPVVDVDLPDWPEPTVDPELTVALDPLDLRVFVDVVE